MACFNCMLVVMGTLVGGIGRIANTGTMFREQASNRRHTRTLLFIIIMLHLFRSRWEKVVTVASKNERMLTSRVSSYLQTEVNWRRAKMTHVRRTQSIANCVSRNSSLILACVTPVYYESITRYFLRTSTLILEIVTSRTYSWSFVGPLGRWQVERLWKALVERL